MSEELIPLFTPALSAVLLAAEDKKASPLTEDEVLKIRDGSTCIMMKAEDVAKMDESRGYQDIDPENCWYDWQLLRRELGRKPDLEPGIKVDYRASNDPGMEQASLTARNSLNEFRNLIHENGSVGIPLVKKTLSDGKTSIHMWLYVEEDHGGSFVASLLEIPTGFTGHQVGDRLTVCCDELLDWMLNVDGTLHGGFSLRHQRSQLSEAEQIDFDRHIGVYTYA